MLNLIFVKYLLILFWFDTGCSVHITNSLDGFKKQKEIRNALYNVFVGEGTKVAV